MILKKPFEDGYCAICTESYERQHDFKAVNVLCCSACMGTPCKNVTMCKKHVEDESSIEEPEALEPIPGEDTATSAEPVNIEALTVAIGMIMKEDTNGGEEVQEKKS